MNTIYVSAVRRELVKILDLVENAAQFLKSDNESCAPQPYRCRRCATRDAEEAAVALKQITDDLRPKESVLDRFPMECKGDFVGHQSYRPGAETNEP